MEAGKREIVTKLKELRDDERNASSSSEDEAESQQQQLLQAPVDAATRGSWLAAFQAVATRRGGGIRTGQVGDALRLAGFVVTEAEARQYQAEADPADEGFVSAEAFLALAAKARREVGGGGGDEQSERSQNFDALRAALAVFDKQSSGRISAVDLRHWLTSLGEPIDDSDVTKMLEHLVDEQGLLDYAELAHRLVGL